MHGLQMRTSALALPALLAVLFVANSARADLRIAGYQDRLHDPYYVGADKAFIGAAYNWSGVGRFPDPSPTGLNWKTLTMISDNYFITANHHQPNRGNDPVDSSPKVRFYRTLDPSGEFWESEIATLGNSYVGQRIGQTDLWVGKLASTPPDWVMRYPLAKRHEATNYLSYTDNKLFIFGQDSPRNWTSLRVGRNEVDNIDISGNLQWNYNPKSGLGADEAETQLGDSGAPSFYTLNKIPVLAGIHTRENFDTGVTKNLAAIQAAVGEQLAFSTGLIGDLNADFRVDITDLGMLADSYGKRTSGVRYFHGDLTGDGKVDVFDFAQVVNNFGKSLYAPTDFDQDGDVDGDDLAMIGDNWLKRVSRPYAAGDANGDGFVNLFDVMAFDRNQFRLFFGPLPTPLSPIAADLTGNGVVDGFDLSFVTSNLGKTVPPGTSGDADGNGVVNELDLAYVTTRIGSSFGDINGDSEVGLGDFLIMANNWNKSVNGGRIAGDLDGDGVVNAADARVLFGWWDQQGGEFPNMLVPEPASLLFAAQLLLCSGCLAIRRPRGWRTAA